jgi:hypothetical protein
VWFRPSHHNERSTQNWSHAYWASKQEASRREASNVVDLTSDHESADSFAGNSQDSASSVQSRKRFSSFVHDLTDDTPSKKGKQEVVDLTAENGPHAANPPRVESQFLTPKVEGVSSLFPVSSLEEADNLQRAMALSLAENSQGSSSKLPRSQSANSQGSSSTLPRSQSANSQGPTLSTPVNRRIECLDCRRRSTLPRNEYVYRTQMKCSSKNIWYYCCIDDTCKFYRPHSTMESPKLSWMHYKW